MFEVLKIRIFGKHPAAKVTDKMLERILEREFGILGHEVKLKFAKLNSDTHSGKNRISAAILKLSNKDMKSIDMWIDQSNQDFRDVISKAEYPRCSKLGFNERSKMKLKPIYLDDWLEYSTWLNK